MSAQSIVLLLADGLMIPLIIISIATLLIGIPSSRKYEAYSRIVISGLTAFLVAKLLGVAFQPSSMRPFELLGTTAGASFMDNPGFPSDHVLLAAFLTLAVWYETKRRYIALILLVLTILIGIGRVAALVHSPIDVAGGLVVAFIGSLWLLQPAEIQNTKPNTRKKHKQLVQ